ncbi:MAG TPA: hypothetical protein VFS21_37630 [Roseiflexaceae bacterium]|nr:hypothetical protein [Roseiflexaceae bacterium]
MHQRAADLGRQGERRIAGILTLTNVAGGVFGFASAWLALGLLGTASEVPWSPLWWVRSLGTVVAIVIGVAITFRWTGLSLWDRLLLWLDWRWRRFNGTAVLTPARPAGHGTGGGGLAPVVLNGQVVARTYRPEGDERGT